MMSDNDQIQFNILSGILENAGIDIADYENIDFTNANEVIQMIEESDVKSVLEELENGN